MIDRGPARGGGEGGGLWSLSAPLAWARAQFGFGGGGRLTCGGPVARASFGALGTTRTEGVEG